MWNLFEGNLSKTNVPFLNTIFEDPVNTAANLSTLGVAAAALNVSRDQLSIAKDSLDYQRSLFHIFNEYHAIEDKRHDSDNEIFLELISEIKKLNQNQEKIIQLLENS